VRYIALLRAVNVGGRTVKMDRLRSALATDGFEEVRTYIATGNVFFDSAERSKASLTERLEALIRGEFGFEVPIALRTLTELEAIVAADPFAKVKISDDLRLRVHFLIGRAPRLDLPLRSPKGEFEIVGLAHGAAFVAMRLVNGRWPSDSWVDKSLGGAGTSRFWHTTVKILEAAKK
jgi:uncharacterized protein (DUF1697 family)